MREPAQSSRLFEHRIEYRREIAGRGIDDLQHLRGGGLLRQRLARLGDQPRILYRDHRLRSEIFEQCYFVIGERPDFLAINPKSAEQPVVLTKGYGESGAGAAKI